MPILKKAELIDLGGEDGIFKMFIVCVNFLIKKI
jgi:hypothetical protein